LLNAPRKDQPSSSYLFVHTVAFPKRQPKIRSPGGLIPLAILSVSTLAYGTPGALNLGPHLFSHCLCMIVRMVPTIFSFFLSPVISACLEVTSIFSTVFSSVILLPLDRPPFACHGVFPNDTPSTGLDLGFCSAYARRGLPSSHPASPVSENLFDTPVRPCCLYFFSPVFDFSFGSPIFLKVTFEGLSLKKRFCDSSGCFSLWS